MSLKSSISQSENSTKKLATNNNSPKSTKAVSPKTFVNSLKYLNAKNTLYPVVMNEFIKLGKTTIAISHDKCILQGAKTILNLETKPVPSIFKTNSQTEQVKEKPVGGSKQEQMLEHVEPEKLKKKPPKRRK